MDRSAGWDENPRRYLTLAVVLALHAVLLALFTMSARRERSSVAMTPPLELIYLATTPLPKRHVAELTIRLLKGADAISATPHALDFPALPSLPSDSDGQSADSNGAGSGIDWAAEARRELQAHEIRQSAPPSENHMAVRPDGETWWPRAAHQKGDQYKTDTGDWLVWINSNCYQVATAAPRGYGLGPPMPQTFCRSGSNSPRGDLFKEIDAYKKLPSEQSAAAK